MTYTSKPAVFCHIVTVQFGREAYTGVGLADEAAKGMADYYAIQQTSYNFDEVPPGVAIGYQVIYLLALFMSRSSKRK